MAKQSATSDRELVISRLLNAPPELVYSVWTDPKHIVQWWGPNGFTTTNKSMEMKVGGTWEFNMHGFGQDFPNRIFFTEIIPNEKISYKHTGDDDTEQVHFEVTITFEKRENNMTLFTMRSLFPSKEELERVIKEYGAEEGGIQTISRMEEHIGRMNKEQEFRITRMINAPRELVWKVQTDPEHLVHWWGPAGSKMSIVKFEFRPGGLLHYCLEFPDGNKMYGKMVYREIQAPERMTNLVSFSDAEGGITRHPLAPTWPLATANSMTLAEVNGQTLLTLTSSPGEATAEERATFEAGTQGMQQGFKGMLDVLCDYVHSIA